MSITWTTLTSLSFLSARVWMHVWSPTSSPFLPQDRPVSLQEVSRVGGPDQNSGGVTHSAPRSSVM